MCVRMCVACISHRNILINVLWNLIKACCSCAFHFPFANFYHVLIFMLISRYNELLFGVLSCAFLLFHLNRWLLFLFHLLQCSSRLNIAQLMEIENVLSVSFYYDHGNYKSFLVIFFYLILLLLDSFDLVFQIMSKTSLTSIRLT